MKEILKAFSSSLRSHFDLCIAFGVLQILLWLSMAVGFLFLLSSCKASHSPQTYEELKKLAQKDTVAHQIPVTVVIPEDTVGAALLPDFMPIDTPYYTRSKSGRLQLKVTKRIDKSLEIEATHRETRHQDTVTVKAPQFVLQECRVDAHMSKWDAERLAQLKLEEYISSRGLSWKEAFEYGKSFLWLLLAILILFIILRLFPR